MRSFKQNHSNIKDLEKVAVAAPFPPAATAEKVGPKVASMLLCSEKERRVLSRHELN